MLGIINIYKKYNIINIIMDMVDSLKTIASNLKLNTMFNKIWNSQLKNNRLLTTIIIANVVVYIMFTIINTFFKLPVVLFLGTILGLWVYNNKKVLT